MAEKTNHIKPYLGDFGAYLMPQGPIKGTKKVPIWQIDRLNVAINSRYLQSGQEAISFGQK